MNLKLLKVARFFHLIKKEKYKEKRQIEIVRHSPFFDEQWYLEQYPDVRASGMTAAEHYVKFGWKEGRNPSFNFDTNDYLFLNPDIKIKNICPVVHFEKYGKKEGKFIHRSYNEPKNVISKHSYLPKIIIMPEFCTANALTSCANIRLKFPYCYTDMYDYFNVELQDYNKRYLPQPGSGKFFVIQRQATAININEFKVWKQKWKESGGIVIYDIDDDLFDCKVTSTKIKNWTAELSNRCIFFAKNADLVTVSTKFLQEKVKPFNKNVQILRNVLDENLWELSNRQQHKVTIGYMGTRSHDNDLKIVTPALNKLKNEFGDFVEFEYIGAIQGPCEIIGAKEIKISNSDYPVFVDCMKKIHWDIGIIPLEHNEFNKSKSDLKFLEFSAMKLAIVVSNHDIYSQVAQHNKNCLVSQNDPNDWYKMLKALIQDRKLRERLSQKAFSQLLEKYTLKHNCINYINTLNRLIK